MAYRRRQGGVTKDSPIKEEVGSPSLNTGPDYSSHDEPPSASSLVAKAIRASSAHRDSSLSSAYGESALSPRDHKSNPLRSSLSSSSKDLNKSGYTSIQILGEPKRGFWDTLARKAKSIIEDDNDIRAQRFETPEKRRMQMLDSEAKSQHSHQLPENNRKSDNPSLQKGLDAIASSLNYIAGTIGNALEEGITIVENRTDDIIQETRMLKIRKRGTTSVTQNPGLNSSGTRLPPLMQIHNEPQTQKASRDVAMAMAAKAKLLLRELKTVKADLAFAKERCAQLEVENRVLRESSGSGDSPEDDDLVRLQLETLLAEKARLAQENSVFARENRLLREIVEYHQLTMQDVVYLDESNEELTEVYPIIKALLNNSLQSLNITPTLPPCMGSPPTSAPSQKNMHLDNSSSFFLCTTRRPSFQNFDSKLLHSHLRSNKSLDMLGPFAWMELLPDFDGLMKV